MKRPTIVFAPDFFLSTTESECINKHDHAIELVFREDYDALEKKLATAREALEGAISQLNYVSDNSGVIKNLEEALKSIENSSQAPGEGE